ncbi:MAG: nucleotidyltransferase domain-containing protein [Lachnospiraceae bacterium]|nr:nucleotidyltransferase domain-containing protein [Lachnospiraceae bacterium]
MFKPDTGIRENVIEEIQELARQHHIKKVILFGSRARGDYRRVSDIDLAACGGDIARFSLDVEEETSTLLKFDVVNLDAAVQPELLASIEKDGRVLYEQV